MVIPENGSGAFNTSTFSVRIMSSDFQRSLESVGYGIWGVDLGLECAWGMGYGQGSTYIGLLEGGES